MALPTATDIRAYLEGFCIDTTTISDAWITARLTNYVVPYIEEKARMSVSGPVQTLEYMSGNGTNILYLNKKNISSIDRIEFVLGGQNFYIFNLANIELISADGVIKAKRNIQETWVMPVFPKGERNIKVTYTYGYSPSALPYDIIEAITVFGAIEVLNIVSTRTGGGSLSVQSLSKGYGKMGKWTELKIELGRKLRTLLRKYETSVV